MTMLTSNKTLTTTESGVEEQKISPLLAPLASAILVNVFGVALVALTGLIGILTNLANISVYLKMGIKETTNMKFFSLSVFDLLVCMCIVVAQITPYQTIADTKMKNGFLWIEIGISATYIAYPCVGCSGWVTPFLSVERYLCIATPLKVKDILTTLRTKAIILIMVTYQSVFLILFFTNPGAPYQTPHYNRRLYYVCSYSFPAFTCFFIVSIATALLIIRLRRSLEWRNEGLAQPNKGSENSKEKKATRSVLAICIIFISCFSRNIGVFVTTTVFPNFTHRDPYLYTLFRAVYAFSILLQVVCSSVNILIYYRMSTKYREIFNSMFYRRANENQ